MNDFKMPIFVIGLIGLLLISGCVNPTPHPGDPTPGPQPDTPSSGWVYYAPVQANTNPWQVNPSTSWAIKPEMEQLSLWLQANGVDTHQFGFIPHDEITCEALNCPRGDYVLVQPTTQGGYDKLIQLGFKSYTEVGVLAANENNSIVITVVNASAETIYYGGCNEYTLEKITPSGNTPIIPKTCIWEGIPSKLDAGKTVSFTYTPTQSGTYRVDFGYGTECTEGQPLSQGNCKTMVALTSVPVTVTVAGGADFVNMIYDIKQCGSNPWQTTEDLPIDPTVDQQLFASWVETNGLHASSVSFVPAEPGTIVCESCACSSGTHYQIVIPASEQTDAEALHFVFNGASFPTLAVPDYAGAQWFLTTPYQCFANKWSDTKIAVHTPEKDMQVMKSWLETKGILVDFLAYIPGTSIGNQCNKPSTDKYAIGLLNVESTDELHQLGFVDAGKTQVGLFTDTTNMKPVSLLYKTKFCSGNPWGNPTLDVMNAADASVAVTQWLADQGVPTFGVPSIHKIAASFSGTCDTDSGLAVYVSVPTWAQTHLNAVGFTKPATQFSLNSEKTQIYPIVETSEGTASFTYAFIQCQTPSWLTDVNEKLTTKQYEQELSSWLVQKGITPVTVEYVQEEGGTCAACGCGGGAHMRIVIPSSGTETVESFGFVADTSA